MNLKTKKQSLIVFMAYVADVVGVALGLKELRHVRRQRVLLKNLLETFLIEKLQSEKVIMLMWDFPLLHLSQ